MKLHVEMALLAVLLASGAGAADECVGFKWDIGKEHALFVGAASRLDAATAAAAAPAVSTERLYEFKLTPQQDVAFAVPPGKKSLTDGAFAGMASFKVDTAGTYRVSLDVPLWIDVVDGGTLVATKDFGGQQGCLPHKIVEYVLEAKHPLTLQMSASSSQVVHLTITLAPSS